MASLSLNSGKTCPGERRPLLPLNTAQVREALSLTCSYPSALRPPVVTSQLLASASPSRPKRPRAPGSRHSDLTLHKRVSGRSSAGLPHSWGGSTRPLSPGDHTQSQALLPPHQGLTGLPWASRLAPGLHSSQPHFPKLLNRSSQAFFFFETWIRWNPKSLSLLVFFFLLAMLCDLWDLVPQPEIKSGSLTVKVQNLNQWTARKFPP